MPTHRGVATRILHPARTGDPAALNRLVPLVYSQLNGLASRLLRGDRAARVLQPADLVHETYIRLLDQRALWHDGEHLLALAARTMRRILVDEARAHHSLKRGGSLTHVPLDEAVDRPDAGFTFDRTFEVDEALAALERLDARDAHIVELRCLEGFTIDEAAIALELSPATVRREWKLAKGWLCDRLRAKPANAADGRPRAHQSQRDGRRHRQSGGYDSEAAFSRAFRRAIGRSPADFRRERQQQPASRPA